VTSSYVLPIPAITLSPTYCQPILDSLIVTNSANAVLSFMALDFAAKNVTITPQYSDIGTHSVIITAKVSMPDILPPNSFNQMI
jgi:hypothetical protein